MKYKAAIFLASYNRGKYVVKAINSVIDQHTQLSYRLFVEENSTDKVTGKMIYDLQNFLPYEFVTVSYNGNNDPIGQMNEFFEKADAEYLFVMHDDMILFPNYLERMVGELEKGANAVYCGMELIRKDKTREIYTQRVKFPNEEMKLASNMEHMQIGFRKSVFEEMEKPYFRKAKWTYTGSDQDTSEVMADNIAAQAEFETKIENLVEVFPVKGAYGNAEVLFIHDISARFDTGYAKI